MAFGNIFIISAPSGAGKHSVLRRVMEKDSNICFSISSTTRRPRPDEAHGRDYYFFTREAFLERVNAGAFAEWAEVHGNLYGTLREELDRRLATGSDVIMQLDVQGMQQLKKLYPRAVAVFLMPPSLDELERRLRARGVNEEDDIIVRLRNAEDEVAQCHLFDYIVVNDDLDKAVADMEGIIGGRRRTAPVPVEETEGIS